MKQSRTLKDLISLSCSVKIYVPSTASVANNMNSDERERFLTSSLVMLSNYFGGTTAYEALGSWVSKEEGLVKERVTICDSFCDSIKLESHISSVISYCESLRDDMGQEAIALEVNNVLHFV